MTKIIRFNQKDKQIDNNGIYVYEKVDENKYTIVKVLGEYENYVDAADTLMKLMGNEVSEDELTQILKEKRKKDMEKKDTVF